MGNEVILYICWKAVLMKTMVLVMYQNYVILELMSMIVKVAVVILAFVKKNGMELVHTAIVEINVVARVATAPTWCKVTDSRCDESMDFAPTFFLLNFANVGALVIHVR